MISQPQNNPYFATKQICAQRHHCWVEATLPAKKINRQKKENQPVLLTCAPKDAAAALCSAPLHSRAALRGATTRRPSLPLSVALRVSVVSEAQVADGVASRRSHIGK